MKRQDNMVATLAKVGLLVGLGLSSAISTTAVHAESGWGAPAPMGPYGGHFDFGIPASSEKSAENSADEANLQAEYAVYQQQDELPVINASYTDPKPASTHTQTTAFSQDELGMIDPAWSMESSSGNNAPQDSAPQGVNGDSYQGDVWALGEIQADKLPALIEEKAPVVAAAAQEALQPCTVQEPAGGKLLTSSHTPFQEAMLDEFEQGDVDMEAMAREADRLSNQEERRGNSWQRAAAPVYFPTYMPDYALGVRRANAMDPLALIPQMSNPVQYFGFQQ